MPRLVRRSPRTTSPMTSRAQLLPARRTSTPTPTSRQTRSRPLKSRVVLSTREITRPLSRTSRTSPTSFPSPRNVLTRLASATATTTLNVERPRSPTSLHLHPPTTVARVRLLFAPPSRRSTPTTSSTRAAASAFRSSSSRFATRSPTSPRSTTLSRGSWRSTPRTRTRSEL